MGVDLTTTVGFPALLLLFTTFAIATVVAADSPSLIVVESASLQLSPSLVVENSPGLKPGSRVVCERVEINGLSRLANLDKFFSSIKVKVYVNSTGRPPNIAICFHRDASLGVGMCPEGQWEKLTKGLWVKSMSPFDHKLLDVRIVGSSVGTIEVSLNEECYIYRFVFLALGITMMTFASSLSGSLVVYYGGAMTLGVMLVTLMILFQGMKLLPTGRRSSLGVVLYSSIVGVGSFVLSYVPTLLRSLLVEMGIGEDMYNPVAVFLLVFLVLFGAWLGFWAVRKLVLTEDGSIDTSVAQFVAWTFRTVASVMILQSSVDPLLAVEALVCGVTISSALKRLVGTMYKMLFRTNKANLRRPHKPASWPVEDSDDDKNRIQRLSESNMFYSTFHNTGQRKQYTKDQWDEFTKESTKRALEGLVSSPDFSRWAVAHADRITLLPKKDTRQKQHSWLSWFLSG